MAPLFTLQIVDRQGRVVHGFAGASPLERDFVQAIAATLTPILTDVAITAITAKGIGLFRTEAQVTTAIRDGLTETVDSAARKAVSAVLTNLKLETRALVGGA